MLVVIIIVLILAALIVPSVWGVYHQSLSAACLVNMRTYGAAVLTMAADEGGLPPWDGLGATTTKTGKPQFNKWLTNGGYLPSKQPLRCPLANDPKMGSVPNETRFPYGGNMNLCEYFPKLVGIPAPSSRVVLAAEASDWDGFQTSSDFNESIWNSTSVGTEGTLRPMARYHGSPAKRGLHFFFLDGSVQLVSPTGNDWTKQPICAPLTGIASTGYFYHSTHFANLKNGTLKAQ